MMIFTGLEAIKKLRSLLVCQLDEHLRVPVDPLVEACINRRR